jgi:putative sigma-54 modulation protein
MEHAFEFHGIASEALRQHAVDRLSAALDQHVDRVAGVLVRMEDTNGRKKSANDKRCQVIVQLRQMPNVVVDERGDDLYAVVSEAADRIKQAVGRQTDRHIERRRATA